VLPHVYAGVRQLLDTHPSAPHYYLPFVGVDPSAQGRGIRAALLKPVLERLGLRVLEVLTLANKGPRMWR
jgi:ribosomal protein S18 acetylase RimI-like enzyme